MRQFIPYLIFGVTTGAVYGLCAMGLVLTYKTSGVFNIGYGAVCAAGAFVFYSVHQSAGLPWPVAAIVTVFGFGGLAGLLLERLAAGLSGVPTAEKVVATVGLLVAVRALVTLIYGSQALTFETFLPQTTVLKISGVSVTTDNLVTVLLGVVTAGALGLLFQRTRTGVNMRAVVDAADLLDLSGTGPASVRRRAWLIGSMFAASSGVLFASAQRQLDVTTVSLVVVQAFGAAALARFTNVPLAFAGGIAVGLLQKLLSKVDAPHASLQGLDLNVPFIVLFLVLVLSPKGRLIELGAAARGRVRGATKLRPPAARAVTGVSLIVALVIPLVVGSKLILWSTGLTQVTLFLSLGLLVRTSGQISLCHAGFAAIGAASSAHLIGAGVPWLLAITLGALVVVPVGGLLAIPAIRLSTLYLALATLGFGILLGQYAYGKNWMFGAQLRAPRPSWLDGDRAYYYLVLAVTLLAVGLVVVVERSRLGRLLRALSDSPTALTVGGANPNVTRTIVFCVSAFIAGISGALYGGLFQSVSGDSFNYVQSLVVLAVLAIAGSRVVPAAVIAAIALEVVPGYVSGENTENVLQLAFGVLAMAAAVASNATVRGAIAGWVMTWRDRSIGPGLVRRDLAIESDRNRPAARLLAATQRSLT